MPIWAYKLDLRDIWKLDGVSFKEQLKVVVERIRKSNFWDEDDYDLPGIVENLESSEDADEFDEWWDEFYDYCDFRRIWVMLV
jgi:hypothetical protein